MTRIIYREPAVSYDPDRHVFLWTSTLQTGEAETLALAWYCAIRDSIPGLVHYHCQGVADAIKELIGEHADRALERACRALPEQVTANYLLNLVGWRIRNARRNRSLELHMGSLDAWAGTIDGIDKSLAPQIQPLVQAEAEDAADFAVTVASIADPQLRLIAQLLAAGWTKAEVARKLDMAPNGITRRMERLRAALLAIYGEDHAALAGRTLRVRGPDQGARRASPAALAS